jgi:hypothetical protein
VILSGSFPRNLEQLRRGGQKASFIMKKSTMSAQDPNLPMSIPAAGEWQRVATLLSAIAPHEELAGTHATPLQVPKPCFQAFCEQLIAFLTWTLKIQTAIE